MFAQQQRSALAIILITALFASLSPRPALAEKDWPAGTKVYVYEEKTTLWSDFGYTYDDCVNPQPGSYQDTACRRRVAWPEGGQEMEVIKGELRVQGEGYVLVNADGRYGWVPKRNITVDGVLLTSSVLSPYPGPPPAACFGEAGKASCPSLKAPTKLRGVGLTHVNLKNGSYLFVRYSASDGSTRFGWVARESLARGAPPSSEQDEAGERASEALPVTEAKPCPPRVSPWDSVTKTLTSAQDAAEGEVHKTGAEFEEFACIHASSKLYPQEKINGQPKVNFSKKKFCAHYNPKGKDKQSFRKSIARAARAFGLPESVIGCTLLIESGLYCNKAEEDEYRCYGQMGRSAIKDLTRYLKPDDSPYRKMWEAYTKRPMADFNSENIRIQGDVEMNVGAVALYLKWLLTNRLPVTQCGDCSGDPNNPNQKDLYMAVAGYNWSPYGLRKIAGISAEDLPYSKDVPEETRNYMKHMDRCLDPGNYDKFRSRKKAGVYDEREKACQGRCP